MYFIISQHTLSIVQRQAYNAWGLGFYHHHRDAAQVNVLVASLLILCWQIDVG
jgi:hypothetical protein